MERLELTRPVLSTAAMRDADRATIEDFGIPGYTLMESASRGPLPRSRSALSWGPARASWSSPDTATTVETALPSPASWPVAAWR